MIGIFLFLSVAALIGSFFMLFSKRKKTFQFLTPYQTFVVGLVIAAVLFYTPYYIEKFKDEFFPELIGKTLLLSLHHAISLFVVALNYEDIYLFSAEYEALGVIYSTYGAILFVLAPLTTFGFVLSYAHSLAARIKIFFCKNKTVYIFSELNENSLCLAKDIKKRSEKSIVIFTNADEKVESERAGELKKISATGIKKSLTAFDASISKIKRTVTYILISDDESKNVNDVFALIREEPEKLKRNVYVYIGDDNRMLDRVLPERNTNIFRFENIHSSVIRVLERDGESIFENARECNADKKEISALVLGVGRYGSEMIKSLSWYTRIDGYKTKIYGFDEKSDIQDSFIHSCPGFFLDDSDELSVCIKGGFAAGTGKLDMEIENIKSINYVFVALGDDDKNINAVYDLCTYFARKGMNPIIRTVVRDDCRKKMLQNKNDMFDIEFIGSTEEIYSYESVFSPDKNERIVGCGEKWMAKDQKGIAEQLIFGETENYRAIESEVMHEKLMTHLSLNKSERKVSSHLRWMYFIYSKGYVYGEKRSKTAKTNPYLVEFEKLPDKFKEYI